MNNIEKTIDITGKVLITAIVGGFGVLAKAAGDALSGYGFRSSSKEYRSVCDKCLDFVHDIWIYGDEGFFGVLKKDAKDISKSAEKAQKEIKKERENFNKHNRRMYG